MKSIYKSIDELVERIDQRNTVTGYNSELSNKSFADKKKIIEENSKACIVAFFFL